MSGDFAIDHKKKTLTGSSSADADKEVKVTVGKALSAEPLVVYLPIPAANYASGYQVEFIDSNDDVMRMRVSRSLYLSCRTPHAAPKCLSGSTSYLQV